MPPENRDFDPGPLADVRTERADDRWTLVFVRELRHPVEKVWAALTDPAQLRRWAPFTADRDLSRPGDATLSMAGGDEVLELPATVRRSEPPTRLEYSWGDDVLCWDLEPTGETTRLTLRHTVSDQAQVPRVAAGWHLCLVVAERWLDGNPIDPIVGEDARNYGWEALHDAYADRLGVTGAGWPDEMSRSRSE